MSGPSGSRHPTPVPTRRARRQGTSHPRHRGSAVLSPCSAWAGLRLRGGQSGPRTWRLRPAGGVTPTHTTKVQTQLTLPAGGGTAQRVLYLSSTETILTPILYDGSAFVNVPSVRVTLLRFPGLPAFCSNPHYLEGPEPRRREQSPADPPRNATAAEPACTPGPLPGTCSSPALSGFVFIASSPSVKRPTHAAFVGCGGRVWGPGHTAFSCD